MKRFLRNWHDKIFIPSLALAAAAGAAIVSTNNENSSRISISVSVPEPLIDSLTLHWKDKLLCPAFVSAYPSKFGIFPISLTRTGLAPPAEESSGKDGDDEKHNCCNCFGRDTIANAAATVGPAVVNISVSRGFHGLSAGRSIGSGTIIDPDGTILTCAHVVDFQGLSTSSKGKVDVTLQDGRVYEGVVVNADLHSDIAIVKIKSKTPLPTAKLGTSNKLRPGDWVVAVGCPLSLQNTVTAGIVSCVDRKSSDLGLGGMRREYLQTDCAINAGNSGGPLVNVDGEVIGVNIMKVLAADGLGFAVPVDSVTKIIDHFKKKGRVIRPWLGLKMLDLNEIVAKQLQERDPSFPKVNKGVLVSMILGEDKMCTTRLNDILVSPGSPGDRAGFQPSDVVVEFDGKRVRSIKEIVDIMGDNIRKTLTVVVRRANNVTATLTVIPEEANPDM